MSRPSRARGLKQYSYSHETISIRVAPLAGAWIETLKIHSLRSVKMSRPSRARGLKQQVIKALQLVPVAPLAGAWIETGKNFSIRAFLAVAPLAGAWIETYVLHLSSTAVLSRPSRARGLKRPWRALQRLGTNVAPLAGAWIETSKEVSEARRLSRAPRGRVD